MTHLCIEEDIVRLREGNNANAEVTAVFVEQLSVPAVKAQVRLEALKDDDSKPAAVSTSESRQRLPITTCRHHLHAVPVPHRLQDEHHGLTKPGVRRLHQDEHTRFSVHVSITSVAVITNHTSTMHIS